MPDDSKKHHDKKKGDPKEQRKPRQRHQAGVEKKTDKKTEELKNAPKVTVPQKPVYESPPPEFYQNLKRETDEILKITEEENTKYKKKEIQSNWSKYEVPIDSYEEIEEQENLGADYEKLIQAPLSIGGHFQFKHEKSWDMNTGPSLYDKYFDINMEDLNLALCSIPFYERNSIPETNFSETDILTMNNRSTRFKQKYFNDKSYSTPETEALDKIINNFRDCVKEDFNEREKDTSNDIDIKCDDSRKTEAEGEITPAALEKTVNLVLETEQADVANIVGEDNLKQTEIKPNIQAVNNTSDGLVLAETNKPVKAPVIKKVEVSPPENSENTPVVDKVTPLASKVAATVPQVDPVPDITKVIDKPAETKKTPVIESPEDLEKWLDDFLDG